jgi:hypothetical protein
MIISHKYKYLFIQTPHTGCTAIGKELIENYGGEEILHKHAMFHDFYRAVKFNPKDYFIFSSIRNPLDEVISLYFKLKNNHEDYSNPKNWKKNGGWLSDRGLKQFEFIYNKKATFEEYLDEFFFLPFVNWTVLDHKKFDYIIRYENLQEGFSEVLKKLKISQVRPIPMINKTQKDSLSIPDKRLKKKYLHVFGPLMKYWDYSFPDEWNIEVCPSLRALALFKFNILIRKIYWKYLF